MPPSGLLPTNAVEFGTAHCIDWSGNDHLYWYGFYPPYGSNGWIFWKPATIGQAHFFSVAQDYQSSIWRWVVDSIQLDAVALPLGYASGITAIVGLESYYSVGSVVYHDAWGLQIDSNEAAYHWQQHYATVTDSHMFGQMQSSGNDWKMAENQSSGGVCGAANLDANLPTGNIWTPLGNITC